MEREPQDKKLFCRWGEFAFVLGTFFIALGVSLMEKGGLGMSMVTSQSYIISLAVPFFTFGMADYLLQGVLLIGYYIIVRRFDWKNILSFFSAFIFGVVLDGCRFVHIQKDTGVHVSRFDEQPYRRMAAGFWLPREVGHD